MPRTPRAVAYFSHTRRVRSSAHLHSRIAVGRLVAAVATALRATDTTRLMWALPWGVDALLTITIAAAWCLWLGRREDHGLW